MLNVNYMASIPNEAIKKLVKRYANANITDDGAREIAQILEKEAERISKQVVKSAKSEKREKITRQDIIEYLMKNEIE